MTFGPLVSVDWLAERLDDDMLRLADCRWYLADPAGGRRAYDVAHVPGAAYVSLDDDLTATTGPGRHPLPSPAEAAVHLGNLGFGDDATVVVYDDAGGAIASRLWWMLRAIGHRRVAVLDGGITQWTAAGFTTVSEPTVHEPAPLTVWSTPLTIDGKTLNDRLGGVILLDARAEARYRGDEEPIDPVGGHIPTAVNAPYAENLNPDSTMRSAPELRARFEQLGVGASAEVVVYCGSGVTACHDILAMEVAGLGPATLYPGSWSDWSSSDRAVATGPAPGSTP